MLFFNNVWILFLNREMKVIQLVAKILLVTTNQILQLSFEAHRKTCGNLRKSMCAWKVRRNFLMNNRSEWEILKFASTCNFLKNSQELFGILRNSHITVVFSLYFGRILVAFWLHFGWIFVVSLMYFGSIIIVFHLYFRCIQVVFWLYFSCFLIVFQLYFYTEIVPKFSLDSTKGLWWLSHVLSRISKIFLECIPKFFIRTNFQIFIGRHKKCISVDFKLRYFNYMIGILHCFNIF